MPTCSRWGRNSFYPFIIRSRHPALARIPAPPRNELNMAECDLIRTEDVFALLAKNLSGYEEREQQLELARSIEYTFKAGKTCVFEAGTGTGKTLAALIPAILTKKKVVVST